MNYFKPYEGSEPYIFVSYAHSDSNSVMEVLTDMHSHGYRIWYDEGIEVGSEWPECIAEHLNGAHLMLAFISQGYMRSDNCRREMHYALMKRIKVINIFLENTEMTPGMEMQIGNIFALMKYNMPHELFYDKLYSAPLLTSESFSENGGTTEHEKPENVPEPAAENTRPEAEEAGREKRRGEKPHKKAEKDAAAQEEPDTERKKAKKRRARRIVWGTIGLLVLAAVISLSVVGHFTGLTERVIIGLNTQEIQPLPAGTKAEFTSEIFENIARDYSGLKDEELYVSDISGLTELYIVGDRWYFSLEDRLASSYFSDSGDIRDLSDLKYFTGLRTLYINGQSLSSLDTMPALGIQYLNISGCRVASLEGVGRLTKLREIYAEGCPVTDLGDIRQCLELRLLDLNGSTISYFSTLKPLTKLTDFSVSNCTTDEMKTVLHISSLTNVAFHGCDLRGSFFKKFDKESRIAGMTLDNCKLDSTVNLDDFSGLTVLTLISSGENLDWTILGELPLLGKVSTDEAMYAAVSRALEGTGVDVELIEE